MFSILTLSTHKRKKGATEAAPFNGGKEIRHGVGHHLQYGEAVKSVRDVL